MKKRVQGIRKPRIRQSDGEREGERVCENLYILLYSKDRVVRVWVFRVVSTGTNPTFKAKLVP